PELHKFQGLVEREQLGGCSASRTTAGPRARVHKQVALGIFGNSFGFTDGMAGNGEVSCSSVIFNCGMLFSRASCFSLAATASGLLPNCAWSLSVPPPIKMPSNNNENTTAER